MTAAVRERLQTLLGTSDRRRLLGITGPPGAGKSTLAAVVAESLGSKCVVVPMDGFHLANVQLRRLGRAGRKGAPDTFDATGYVALLKRLRSPVAGEVVYAPEFRREVEEGIAGAIAVPPEVPLVVTEGNYLLLEDGGWGSVRGLLDDCWYVDLEDGPRRARLSLRHQQFGRSAVDAEAWVAQTDEPNARLIAAGRDRASFFVQSE